MASVLVTGARGFIGRALCASAGLAPYRVIALSRADGDLADSATLKGVVPTSRVVHLAGRVSVPESWSNPADFHRANLLSTLNVLEYCCEHDAALVFISAYLYGIPERLPVSETSPPRPNNPYALSKHLAEQACEFYARHRGVSVTVLRPFNIFGPAQRPDFLIPHILRQVAAGDRVVVDDLAPRRDYLFVDDLVEAIVRSLDAKWEHEVINVGSGRSHSVGELIAAIQDVAQTRLPVVCADKPRHNEIPDVYADIARAEARLGWRPRIGLRDGLERLIALEAEL